MTTSTSNEILLIAIVIVVQLILFGHVAFFKIRRLKRIFPEINSLSLTDSELSTLEENSNKVVIIEEKQNFSKDFKKILKNTNEYLENNKGAAADFNLIKDITERTDQMIERSINSMVGLPLYIGLLGTMFGIVYGLYYMDENLTDPKSIGLLLRGVKIAMVGSFTGLLLTLINSGFILKSGKYKRDKKKSDYYTFIQKNLLPVLSDDMASSLKSIESQLSKFNRDFSENIHSLDVSVSTISGNLLVQQDFLERVEKIGFSQLTTANIKIFEKLQQSIIIIDDFNNYFYNVSNLIQENEDSLESINNAYSNISSFNNDISTIIKTINEKLTDNHELLAYLKANYSGLEKISDQTSLILNTHEKSIKEVSNNYENFLTEYKTTQTDSLKELTAGIENGLKQTFDDFTKITSNILEEQLKSINNTSDSFSDGVEAIKKQYEDNFRKLSEEITGLVKSLHNEVSSGSIKNQLNSISDNVDKIHDDLSSINPHGDNGDLNLISHNLDEIVKLARKTVEKKSVLSKLFGRN